MEDEPEESPTLGERMNRGMYLDPGFTQDKPNLIGALRDEIDHTAKRAQANLDQQRQNAAEIESLANELAREAHRKDVAHHQPPQETPAEDA